MVLLTADPGASPSPLALGKSFRALLAHNLKDGVKGVFVFLLCVRVDRDRMIPPAVCNINDGRYEVVTAGSSQFRWHIEKPAAIDDVLYSGAIRF